MGAGRKKQTLTLPEKSLPLTNKGIGTARNLGKDKLAAVIFGCTNYTIEECFSNELFGLPEAHQIYVSNIRTGLPLFLFNYSNRKLQGIFEAVCTGRHINPQAWTEEESYSSPYPAQVKSRIRLHCRPLSEDQFSPVIANNYYESKLFWFELDNNQAKELISLFSSSPMTPKEINHQRTLFGSYARGKQKLERQIDESEEKQQKEVACANTIPGLSYSSVLKSTSLSIAHNDQPHVRMGTSSDKTWSALFDKEIVPNAESKIDGSAIQSSSLNYMGQPNVRMGTSSHKSWSALFDKETVLNAESSTDCFQSFPLNDSFMDQPNLQWESSSYIDNIVSEFPIMDESENCGNVAAGDKRDEVDEFGLTLDERQWSSSYEADEFGSTQDERQWSSSHVPHSWEEDSQPPEVHMNEDSLKKEHLYTESDCEHSLHASMKNMVLEEDWAEEDAEIKSREAIVSEIQPREFCSMVSQLLQEVQELKESHSVQCQKISLMEHELLLQEVQELKESQSLQSQRISLLEQELITSRLTIQQLRYAQKTLKSSNLNFGELIFIAGGFDGSSWFSSLDAYSPYEDLKRPLASMSSSRSHASAVNRLDPREPSWRQLNSMTSTRAFHSLVLLNDKLYALGGYDGHMMLSSVELLDPRVGSWMTEGSMNECRGYCGAFVMRDAIYVLGGLNENNQVLDTVECY